MQAATGSVCSCVESSIGPAPSVVVSLHPSNSRPPALGSRAMGRTHSTNGGASIGRSPYPPAVAAFSLLVGIDTKGWCPPSNLSDDRWGGTAVSAAMAIRLIPRPPGIEPGRNRVSERRVEALAIGPHPGSDADVVVVGVGGRVSPPPTPGSMVKSDGSMGRSGEGEGIRVRYRPRHIPVSPWSPEDQGPARLGPPARLLVPVSGRARDASGDTLRAADTVAAFIRMAPCRYWADRRRCDAGDPPSGW